MKLTKEHQILIALFSIPMGQSLYNDLGIVVPATAIVHVERKDEYLPIGVMTYKGSCGMGLRISISIRHGRAFQPPDSYSTLYAFFAYGSTVPAPKIIPAKKHLGIRNTIRRLAHEVLHSTSSS